MNTVLVNPPSKTYEVKIGSGLLAKAGELAAKVHTPANAVIITDSTVDKLYAETLKKSLKAAGYTVFKTVIPAGEQSKNAETLINTLNSMAECRLTRADTVFALGGGVVGDLAGLAAALFMRGIGLVQIPTTLLAAVDSSVGGKTAIDLKTGKNLIGAFYQPDSVICDTDTLKTLPPSEFSNGCAEVIKYGFIRDAAVFGLLSANDFDREAVITRCVEIKRDVVCADERDTGERQLLNFGHTFGHAVEQRSNFMLAHGSAVAVGMALMTKAAVKKGLCDPVCLDILKSLLTRYNLPASTSFSEDEIFDTVLTDKKRLSDKLTLVVPRKPGQCDLMKLPIDEVREFLHLGLEGVL